MKSELHACKNNKYNVISVVISKPAQFVQKLLSKCSTNVKGRRLSTDSLFCVYILYPVCEGLTDNM